MLQFGWFRHKAEIIQSAKRIVSNQDSDSALLPPSRTFLSAVTFTKSKEMQISSFIWAHYNSTHSGLSRWMGSVCRHPVRIAVSLHGQFWLAIWKASAPPAPDSPQQIQISPGAASSIIGIISVENHNESHFPAVFVSPCSAALSSHTLFYFDSFDEPWNFPPCTYLFLYLLHVKKIGKLKTEFLHLHQAKV